MIKDYLKTGIMSFDKLVNPGILKDSIIALTGPTGSGKTIFGMQFLVEGAKQFGEPGLFIAFEGSKETTYNSVMGLEWNLRELEKDKKIVILDYPVNEAEQFMSKNAALGDLITKMGIRRVVVDSILPIALLGKDKRERDNLFLHFIANLRTWDITVFLISDERRSSEFDFPISDYQVESLCDGWIRLGFERTKRNTREKTLEVMKMRGAEHSNKRHTTKISRSGFEVVS